MDELDLTNNNVVEEDALDEEFVSLRYSSFFESVSDERLKQGLKAMGDSGTSNLDLQTSIMSTTSDNLESVADNFQDALEISSDNHDVDASENDRFTDASEYPSLSYIIVDANSRLSNENEPEESEPLSLWSAIQDSAEFLDDTPSNFNQYVMSVLEYEDPSANYQFVNDPQRLSHLDNSEALLEQLRGMGVSVNRDYLTLDIDFSISGPNSLQDDGSVGDAGDSSGLEMGLTSTQPPTVPSNKNSGCEPQRISDSEFNNGVRGEDPGVLSTAGRFLRRLSAANESRAGVNSIEEPASHLLSVPGHDDEVVEAHFTPDGNIKVIYDNLSKDYRSRVSSHDDHIKYLQLMDLEHSASGTNSTNPDASDRSGTDFRSVPGNDGKFRRRLVLVRRPLSSSELKEDIKKFASRVPLTLRELPHRCRHKIRRLLAPEAAADATTPDSGVHENMTGLSPEEQERQTKQWEAELAKTEEEIATLRTVLASKVNHAHELKRRLGITVWKELSDDINQSLKTVRESQPVAKAEEVIAEFSSAVASAPLYQKTAGAIGAVGEKTSSLFGGIGAKFGQLKETPTFKSFEERVGGVYTAARSKIPGGSGSNSTQDLDEAFKEMEGEKAAAEAAANMPAQDGVAGVGVDHTQQQQPQQQSLA